MEKMTYVKALNAVLANENLETEVREKLVALVASLEKRNAKAGTRKPTKIQRENVAVKDSIVEVLATFEGPVQAKVVADALALSNQKASAMLNQLVADGVVVKTEGAKKVSLFALLAGNEEV